jgi:hypothetical protein
MDARSPYGASVRAATFAAFGFWLAHSAGSRSRVEHSCSPPSARFAGSAEAKQRQVAAGSPAKESVQQACKAKQQALARGAVAKRSAQSERHVSRCPEACACHGPRKGGAGAQQSKERGVAQSVGVCCPAFAQVSVAFSAGLNPRRRTPQPGRVSPGSPDMLQRGVVRVALRLRRLSQVERQCVGMQTVQKRLRRG